MGEWPGLVGMLNINASLTKMGVPVVVSTGYSGSDSVPEAMHGLQRLCKPFTQAELAQAVAQTLSARA